MGNILLLFALGCWKQNMESGKNLPSGTKYSVEFKTIPETILPNEPVELKLAVFNKYSGKPVEKFKPINGKLMHLTIFNVELTEYQHVFPKYTGNWTFTILATLPYFDDYRIYAEYSPDDSGEVLSILNATTGYSSRNEKALLYPEPLSETFGKKYNVTLSFESFDSDKGIDFIYSIRDSKTLKDISNLDSNLTAFGFLVIVSDDGMFYRRIYPLNETGEEKKEDDKIEFNAVFEKPGWYKLFAEFSHEKNVFLTDFTVKIDINKISNNKSGSGDNAVMKTIVELFNETIPPCMEYG